MARSTRIYLVFTGIFNSNDFQIHGCFTVRHEAIAWMEKMMEFDPHRIHHNLRIISTGDNQAYDPVLVVKRRDFEHGSIS